MRVATVYGTVDGSSAAAAMAVLDASSISASDVEGGRKKDTAFFCADAAAAVVVAFPNTNAGVPIVEAAKSLRFDVVDRAWTDGATLFTPIVVEEVNMVMAGDC